MFKDGQKVRINSPRSVHTGQIGIIRKHNRHGNRYPSVIYPSYANSLYTTCDSYVVEIGSGGMRHRFGNDKLEPVNVTSKGGHKHV